MPLVETEHDTYEVSYKLQTGTQSTIEYDSNTLLNEEEQACLAYLRDFQFNDAEKKQTLKSCFAPLLLERKLIILQIFFHEFQDENLSMSYDVLTIPALSLMLKEQKGVCGQRAVLCREIAEIIGLHWAHTVTNDIHAFCEIENYRIDLGGGNRSLLEYTPDLQLFLPLSSLATDLTSLNLSPSIPNLVTSTHLYQIVLNPLAYQEINKFLLAEAIPNQTSVSDKGLTNC